MSQGRSWLGSHGLHVGWVGCVAVQVRHVYRSLGDGSIHCCLTAGFPHKRGRMWLKDQPVQDCGFAAVNSTLSFAVLCTLTSI
jgi:hypothetical protein